MPSFRKIAAPLLLAVSAVQAEVFWLAQTSLNTVVPGPVGDDGNDRFVVAAAFECSSLTDAGALNKRSDLTQSGNGVRIKNVNNSPEEIEMKIDRWHATWYVGTGNLWDTNNVQRGACELIETEKARCDLDLGWAEYQSVLRCEAEFYD